MVIQIIQYKSSDGELWDSEKNAILRERLLMVRDLFEEHSHCGDLSPIKAAEVTANNLNYIADIMEGKHDFTGKS